MFLNHHNMFFFNIITSFFSMINTQNQQDRELIRISNISLFFQYFNSLEEAFFIFIYLEIYIFICYFCDAHDDISFHLYFHVRFHCFFVFFSLKINFCFLFFSTKRLFSVSLLFPLSCPSHNARRMVVNCCYTSFYLFFLTQQFSGIS